MVSKEEKHPKMTMKKNIVAFINFFKTTQNLMQTPPNQKNHNQQAEGGAQSAISRGHILEIKKIHQHIINYVNISVLKLEKRYLHKNGVELN